MGTLCQLLGRWGVVCINQHYPWKGRAAIHSERTSAHMSRALVKALVTALNLFPCRIQNELTWWGWPPLLAQRQVQNPVLEWDSIFTTFNLPCSLFQCDHNLNSFNDGSSSAYTANNKSTEAFMPCSRCCRTIYLWLFLLPPTQMVSLGPRCEWLGRPLSLISFSDDSHWSTALSGFPLKRWWWWWEHHISSSLFYRVDCWICIQWKRDRAGGLNCQLSHSQF